MSPLVLAQESATGPGSSPQRVLPTPQSLALSAVLSAVLRPNDIPQNAPRKKRKKRFRPFFCRRRPFRIRLMYGIEQVQTVSKLHVARVAGTPRCLYRISASMLYYGTYCSHQCYRLYHAILGIVQHITMISRIMGRGEHGKTCGHYGTRGGYASGYRPRYGLGSYLSRHLWYRRH